MKYIVGLGNPGKKYALSRHNVGWFVLDALALDIGCGELSVQKYWQAGVCYGEVDTESVCLVYPETYMNRSGETVAAILKDDPEALVVIVHDDVALPVGEIKISTSRGHGGHNGLKSVFSRTKRNDFDRVRVGVAGRHLLSRSAKIPAGNALPQHVLGNFTFLEKAAVRRSVETAVDALSVLLKEGVSVAMNKYN